MARSTAPTPSSIWSAPTWTRASGRRCSSRLPGRLVVVNSTAASFPFLERLAGPQRIVITATESVAQRFDTVFPEYFIKALTDPAADLDKNGRVSIWEAFIAASGGVRRYYEQRGQLATERALLDDNGDGQGREAGADGDDGSNASRLYLEPDVPGAPPPDEELLALLQKRAALEVDADELKQRRPLMTPRRVSEGVRAADDRARESVARHPSPPEDVGPGRISWGSAPSDRDSIAVRFAAGPGRQLRRRRSRRRGPRTRFRRRCSRCRASRPRSAAA